MNRASDNLYTGPIPDTSQTPPRGPWRMVTAGAAAALIVGTLTVPPAQANPTSVLLVEDSEARAAVVIPDGAPLEIAEAASDLVSYVALSTTAELPILTESQALLQPPSSSQAHVYIGVGTAATSSLPQPVSELDEDGFAIVTDVNTVTVVGPTPRGTRYGVYEFLERFVGVRWLMPGESGEHVPSHEDLIIETTAVQEEPAAISRVFSGLGPSPAMPADPLHPSTQVQTDWARHNRMQDRAAEARIEFHHNLYNLFPPSVYAQTNPEFYPGGVAPPTNAGWQPCFTAPGIVDEAIVNIVAYFDDNPDETSYSLGMNDSGGFCEADPGHPSNPGTLNSVGRVHMSEIYFGWVNQVVAGVLAVHPDKKFGLLVYRELFDPPSFTVNSAVIPFITDDRMTWALPDAQEAGEEQTELWAGVAENLGWYEYFYGSFYEVPRVYPRVSAENYAFAADNGVIAHYAELYTNWGEGPKAWVSAKLQWDPDQDVEALLEEWYTTAVGPAAAPYLASYYDLWEDFWTDRVFDSPWFDSWYKSETRNNYLPIGDPSYLALVTAQDLTTSRSLLEQTVQAAATAAQQERASLLLKAFDYYEASVKSYSPPDPAEPPATEVQALEMLSDAVTVANAAERRLLLREEFADDPVLVHSVPVERTGLGAIPKWQPHQTWSLLDWLGREADGGAVATAVAQAADGADGSLGESYAELLLAASTDPTVSADPSFESTGTSPWALWRTGGTMSITDTGESHSGSRSVVATGVPRGAPWQTLPAEPGPYHATAAFYTPSGYTGTGTVQLQLSLDSASGTQLGILASTPRQVSNTSGTWSTVTFDTDVPDDINGIPVARIRFFTIINGFSPGEIVRLDDARLDRRATVTVDSSFESTGTSPWGLWRTTGTMTVSHSGSPQNGTGMVVAEGVSRGGPWQAIPAAAGRYGALVSFYTPSGYTGDGTIQLQLNLDGAQSAMIGRVFSTPRKVAITSGVWTTVELIIDVPEDVGGVPVDQMRLFAILNGFQPGEVVNLDDLALYRLDG